VRVYESETENLQKKWRGKKGRLSDSDETSLANTGEKNRQRAEESYRRNI